MECHAHESKRRIKVHLISQIDKWACFFELQSAPRSLLRDSGQPYLPRLAAKEDPIGAIRVRSHVKVGPLSILSRHIPLGEGEGLVALNETVSPLKHTDWSSGEPPKELQKSLWDCHASVSFDGELGGGAVPCRGGWKGQFVMLTSLQVSQTSLQ